ncbi:MAG: NDP-sugar synthase [Candidatus Limisoma sp.]
MKAMIFAAGLGTRLRPLTDNKPKALVEVAGVPMLERVIVNLKSYGFTDIVINVHHFGEQIIDFVESHRRFDINIAISDERNELLDTGGGILHARHLLDDGEPFLVHNADILTDLNLSELYAHHLNSHADATLLVAERTTSRYLLFDDNHTLRGWTNIKTGEIRPEGISTADLQTLAFGGIHVISPSIFDALSGYTDQRKFSITPFYVDSCTSLNIKGFSPAEDYRWFDIGKLETLRLAEQAIADRP